MALVSASTRSMASKPIPTVYRAPGRCGQRKARGFLFLGVARFQGIAAAVAPSAQAHHRRRREERGTVLHFSGDALS